MLLSEVQLNATRFRAQRLSPNKTCTESLSSCNVRASQFIFSGQCERLAVAGICLSLSHHHDIYDGSAGEVVKGSGAQMWLAHQAISQSFSLFVERVAAHRGPAVLEVILLD